MPTYDKSLPKLNKRGSGRGRPAKRSAEVEKTILDQITEGAPYVVACSYAGISHESFNDWRRRDAEFNDRVEKATAACTMRRVRKIERHGEETFAALAWLLERRHPELFGRPEIQLAVVQQNNVIENSLTIHITESQATEIETQAQPVREKVQAMISAYRPLHEQSNGTGEVRAQETEPVAQQSWEPPPISHRDTDATNPSFWRALVDNPPERKVSRASAVFAVRMILAQTLGFKAHRLEITFGSDPITVEEMFGVLEKFSGGSAGWQLAQKLAGY